MRVPSTTRVRRRLQRADIIVVVVAALLGVVAHSCKRLIDSPLNSRPLESPRTCIPDRFPINRLVNRSQERSMPMPSLNAIVDHFGFTGMASSWFSELMHREALAVSFREGITKADGCNVDLAYVWIELRDRELALQALNRFVAACNPDDIRRWWRICDHGPPKSMSEVLVFDVGPPCIIDYSFACLPYARADVMKCQFNFCAAVSIAGRGSAVLLLRSFSPQICQCALHEVVLATVSK